MKRTLFATAVSVAALSAAPALAEPVPYVLDSSHSQVLFSYNHLGFSTTWGMFSGFEGEITFDQENPAASSVTVSMPTKSMFTGWEQRDGHFMSADFFGASDGDMVSFTSTAIEVTGDQFVVSGSSYVIVYDGKFWSREGSDLKKLPPKEQLFYFLRAGDRYDLKNRKVLRFY